MKLTLVQRRYNLYFRQLRLKTISFVYYRSIFLPFSQDAASPAASFFHDLRPRMPSPRINIQPFGHVPAVFSSLLMTFCAAVFPIAQQKDTAHKGRQHCKHPGQRSLCIARLRDAVGSIAGGTVVPAAVCVIHMDVLT